MPRDLLPWTSPVWWFLVTAPLASGVIWVTGRWILRTLAHEVRDWWIRRKGIR